MGLMVRCGNCLISIGRICSDAGFGFCWAMVLGGTR